jgi:hypothetical protein
LDQLWENDRVKGIKEDDLVFDEEHEEAFDILQIFDNGFIRELFLDERIMIVLDDFSGNARYAGFGIMDRQESVEAIQVFLFGIDCVV